MSGLYLFAIIILSLKGYYFKNAGINLDEYQPSNVEPNVWPYPQSIVSFDRYFEINSNNFTFITKLSSKCELIDNAIARYKSLTFLEDCSRLGSKAVTPLLTGRQKLAEDSRFAGQLTNITVQISGGCESYPRPNSSEMYTIDIGPDESLLFAESVWGAIRGLETLSQLVRHVGANQFAVNWTVVLDYPRFQHRGLLLDTSRHYVPVRVLRDNLDAMAHNKMNVFHWHIVDDPSFPYVSRQFPALSANGAFNSKTMVYSAEDVADLIEYARQRAIRVLVEFDTPGHTLSWGKGQTDLLTRCYTSGQPNGQFGPIDPTKQSTYNFLSKLFAEIVATFPDAYLHLGGDEVDFGCWQSNPAITEFMRERHIAGDYAKLEEYYIGNALAIVAALNRSYIVWQEVFDNGVTVRPDTVVHVWRDGWQSELFNVTDAGYQSLLSSCWYLNYISYGSDWPQYYDCDPHNFNGTERQRKLVIGGEACMWGEWVDGTNLMSRTWPRAIAVAERLWSSVELTDHQTAAPRFDAQHCRMQQRGIRAEPANGVGFCPCDYAL